MVRNAFSVLSKSTTVENSVALNLVYNDHRVNFLSSDSDLLFIFNTVLFILLHFHGKCWFGKKLTSLVCPIGTCMSRFYRWLQGCVGPITNFLQFSIL